MREILFRAKQSDTGEWIEGQYAFILNPFTESGEPIKHIICNGTNIFCNEINPETLCQFIGLKDKNGRRIFEGDIFEFDDEVWESSYTSCGTEYNSWNIKNYGVVGYCDESARYDFTKYKYNENSVEANLHENNALDFAEFVSELGVIGNIFDNPELLKEETLE